MVFEKAEVIGNVIVYGNAWVFGDALFFDKVQISGDAQVFGKTKIHYGITSIDYCFTLTEQVKEYLKSVENLKTRLNAIGAKSVLRK